MPFDRKAGRALVISMFVLLGLLLMGSSVCGGLDGHHRNALMETAYRDPAPVWWNDGSRIAVAMPPEGMYVVDVQGSEISTFPPGAPVGACRVNWPFSPALSPDESRLVYAVAKRDGRSEIMTAAIDGSDVRRLTRDKGVHVYPTWSPDGTRIAFMSGSRNRFEDLHVMDADGSNTRKIASTNSHARNPAWSPDGSRIAFVDRDESRTYIVYTVRPDGSDLIEIGNTQSDLAWSPDGSRIAFMRVIVNKPKAADRMALTVADPDGSNGRDLASWERGGSRWVTALSWSPDGSKIAYGFGYSFEIVSADGTDTPVTVPGERGQDRRTPPGVAWSPDGLTVAFYSNRVLFTTAHDGSDRRVLARGASEANWVGTGGCSSN